MLTVKITDISFVSQLLTIKIIGISFVSQLFTLSSPVFQHTHSTRAEMENVSQRLVIKELYIVCAVTRLLSSFLGEAKLPHNDKIMTEKSKNDL